jgi:hypothetical protein
MCTQEIKMKMTADFSAEGRRLWNAIFKALTEKPRQYRIICWAKEAVSNKNKTDIFRHVKA